MLLLQVWQSLMKYLRFAAMWIVWNVPFGRLAPWLMGFAANSKPRKIQSAKFSK